MASGAVNVARAESIAIVAFATTKAGESPSTPIFATLRAYRPTRTESKRSRKSEACRTLSSSSAVMPLERRRR